MQYESFSDIFTALRKNKGKKRITKTISWERKSNFFPPFLNFFFFPDSSKECSVQETSTDLSPGKKNYKNVVKN